MKYYFGYGANMNFETFLERCPGAAFVHVGELRRYRFIINTRGVASIVPDQVSSVYGVIWEISEENEEFLDLFEGVRGGWYGKHTLDVNEIPTMKKSLLCLVYIASCNEPGTPIESYFDDIRRYSKYYRFPAQYTGYLETLAPHPKGNT